MSAITTIGYQSAIPRSGEVPTESRHFQSNANSTTIGSYLPAGGVEGTFAGHFAKLRSLAIDRALIPDESDAPCSDSLHVADRILRELLRIEFAPTRVTASAEGGVAICFVKGDKYSDIECLNSGEILGVTSNRKDRPLVWEIEPGPRCISQAIVRIRKFVEE